MLGLHSYTTMEDQDILKRHPLFFLKPVLGDWIAEGLGKNNFIVFVDLDHLKSLSPEQQPEEYLASHLLAFASLGDLVVYTPLVSCKSRIRAYQITRVMLGLYSKCTNPLYNSFIHLV